jgi:hypothetical protein
MELVKPGSGQPPMQVSPERIVPGGDAAENALRSTP